MIIKVSEKVKLISDEIAIKAAQEAEYFPVDRIFLERYIQQILTLDPVEFIFYNFERGSSNYTPLLFLCLPEIWIKIDLEDIINMMHNFSNSFSYFVLIRFSYKYLEVDILHLIMESVKDKKEYYNQIKEYLLKQWNNFIKDDDEKELLETGYEQEYYAYDPEQWSYIRQKFLVDKRVEPAIQDYKYIRDRIESLLQEKIIWK